jgi:hypothetical protein
MARQSYSGTPDQFKAQVNSAVDQLRGSIDAQLKYRQLTEDNQKIVRDILKDVEGYLRFTRRYQFTEKATSEPVNGGEQTSLLEEDGDDA